MDALVRNRLRGALFGQAIGDAWGLATEFMTKAEAAVAYPRGVSGYGAIVQDEHRRRWAPGAWTDDTDQALCILDSVIEKRAVDPLDIAARIFRWSCEGGLGMGNLVLAVTGHHKFRTDPHAAAKDIWQRRNREAASNGGVMRTSPLGLWEFRDAARVRANAAEVCRITHFDPRCVASAVAVSDAIAAMLRGGDARSAYEGARAQAVALDSRTEAAFVDDLESLDLDEPERIGSTLKTLGAGMWALAHAPDFEEGVHRVMMEGGDGDTNACVTGALLGARDGIDGIPVRLVEGLVRHRELEERCERLLAVVS